MILCIRRIEWLSLRGDLNVLLIARRRSCGMARFMVDFGRLSRMLPRTLMSPACRGLFGHTTMLALEIVSIPNTFPPNPQRLFIIASRLRRFLLPQSLRQLRKSSLPLLNDSVRQLGLRHFRAQDFLGKVEAVPNGNTKAHFELWPRRSGLVALGLKS